MAKLTQKQIRSLELIASHLDRALKYIHQDDVSVVHKFGKDDVSVNKHYGSNLTGLEMGLSDLRKFLAFHASQPVSSVEF